MKKKILIVSGVFPPEQVTSALMNYDLARELSKEYDVTVLRPYPTRPMGMKFDYKGMEEEPFETILVDSYTHPQSQLIGRFRESIDFGRKCSKYILENHNDIAFIYNNPWQLFGVKIIAKAAKKYNIPYTIVIQDIYPECLLTNKHYSSIITSLAMNLLKPIDRYYQKHAVFIRTISDEMADYLSSTRKLSRDKYLVVNNWQNDEDFLKEYPARPADGKLVFAYVGSINGHANVDLMIKAFAEAKIENAEFRIYGGGNKKDYCVDLVRQLGAKNIFFDMVSRDKVAFVQSQADVLLLALPKGNGNLCLPSKLTSYMLSGKPVLASVDQDSSTKRILNGNNSGLTVPPDNLELLTKAFEELGRMPVEKRNEKGMNSRHYAVKELTREMNLNKVVSTINDILKKG